MKTMFGFIGCGNMGGALAEAVAKKMLGEQIMVCDAFAEKAERLAKLCGAQIGDAKTVAGECQYIFVGVKPCVRCLQRSLPSCKSGMTA